MAAANKGLPEGFNRWGLADAYGTTVAHVAASYGNLPKGFDQWGLKDPCDGGKTVAHVVARAEAGGGLPADFNQWDLADESGRTVAQVVEANALRRPLPESLRERKLLGGLRLALDAALAGGVPTDKIRAITEACLP